MVYYSYFDTVINAFLIASGGLDIHHGEIVGLAVEAACRFHKPLSFPETVDAGSRVGKLGRSSVRYEIGLFREADGEAAADDHFVHVFVRRADRTATPIPPTMRAALAPLVVGG